MQRKLRLRALVIGLIGAVFLSALLASRPAWAAITAPDLPWWTPVAGGGTSSGATYSLYGTIGQRYAHPGGLEMSGGGYTLTDGFWPGVTTPRYTLHLPLVMRE